MKETSEIHNSHRLQIVVAIMLMLISLHVPYSRMLSYVYQVSAIIVLSFVYGTSCYLFIPVLLLTTTRSYIAVSINSSFTEYLGINGETLLVYMCYVLFSKLGRTHFRLRIDYGYGALLLLAVLMAISRLWATNQYEYNSYFLPICLIYITFPLLIESEKDIVVSRYAFVLSGIFGAIEILPHMLSVGNIYEAAVLVDRNYQACFFLICLLQTVCLMIDQTIELELHQIVICWISIFADTYIIVSGASRSGLIALGVSALLYVVLNIKRLGKTVVGSLIAGIGIFYLFGLGIFDFVISRFSLSNLSTGNGREMLLEEYLIGFSQSNILQIILGHGLVGQSVYGRVAHNVYVSVLYSFGIIGFLSLMNVVIYCFRYSVKTRDTIVLMSLLPILVMCFTIEPYYRVEFAVYLGSLVGVVRQRHYIKEGV